ncbi:hypothetical protein V7095_04680, partial [Bacillus thuringiensis]|uniref:hypothetical protein n=1 Tax=Bacillus thuringiensis TaxID=1428 RepID=UPI002FFDF53E
FIERTILFLAQIPADKLFKTPIYQRFFGFHHLSSPIVSDTKRYLCGRIVGSPLREIHLCMTHFYKFNF